MVMRASGISPAVRWLVLAGMTRSLSPCRISVGHRMPASRWSASWSGVPQSRMA